MITDYDVSSQDILMYFSPLFPVITIVSTDHVYFHHKIILMIVVIQNFQLEVVNKLKYVGDTGPDPEEEEDGAGPRGQCGRRHQP